MKPRLRDLFDQHLEYVLGRLPARVRQLLDEVPLVVEDFPANEIMEKMRVRHRSQLCGLYTGIPLTQRSVEYSGVLSDVIHIYREGIMSLARDAQGRVDQEELRRQIQITVLHELGHHHGLGEKELRDLGY